MPWRCCRARSPRRLTVLLASSYYLSPSREHRRTKAPLTEHPSSAVPPRVIATPAPPGTEARDGRLLRLEARDADERAGEVDQVLRVHLRAAGRRRPSWCDVASQAPSPRSGRTPPAHAPLALTYFSTWVVVLPFAVKAMWENAESRVAPCQCFSSEGICTTSPGIMICCSVSVAMMPLPAVTNST